MSITTGVCARMGPWPSSCGSTAWSPGAQMVCEGTQPTRHDPRVDRGAQVLGREAPAVPPQLAVAPDAARAQRGEARPPGRPPPRAAPAVIARISSGRLISRSGQKGSSTRSSRTPRRVELHGQAEREARAAPPRARSFRSRSTRAITAAAVGRRPSASTRFATARPGQHPVHARLLPRAVALEVAHHQDARAALLHEQERIRREEAGRVQDVGVRLGRGVEEDVARARAASCGSAGQAGAPPDEHAEQQRGRRPRPRSGSRRATNQSAWACAAASSANMASSGSRRRSRTRRNCSSVDHGRGDVEPDHPVRRWSRRVKRARRRPARRRRWRRRPCRSAPGW